METVTDFIFSGSKITADGDCSHEIKRHLLLGRKAMSNLDSILKSRDVTLPTKVRLVKAMLFPVVMYGWQSWTIKNAEHQRIDAFCLFVCFELMLLNCGVGEDSWEPVDCKEIKPVNPKGNQFWIFSGRTDDEAEAPILWPPDGKIWLIKKNPDAGKDWRQEGKGMTEDEMVGWHHRLEGHESEQAPGDGEGQGSLACCSPWNRKESDTTEQLNNKNDEVKWVEHPVTLDSNKIFYFNGYLLPTHPSPTKSLISIPPQHIPHQTQSPVPNQPGVNRLGLPLTQQMYEWTRKLTPQTSLGMAPLSTHQLLENDPRLMACHPHAGGPQSCWRWENCPGSLLPLASLGWGFLSPALCPEPSAALLPLPSLLLPFLTAKGDGSGPRVNAWGPSVQPHCLLRADQREPGGAPRTSPALHACPISHGCSLLSFWTVPLSLLCACSIAVTTAKAHSPFPHDHPYQRLAEAPSSCPHHPASQKWPHSIVLDNQIYMEMCWREAGLGDLCRCSTTNSG